MFAVRCSSTWKLTLDLLLVQEELLPNCRSWTRFPSSMLASDYAAGTSSAWSPENAGPEDDAQGPDVVLDGLEVVLETFGAHVEGTADIDLLFGVAGGFLGKAEIGYFRDFVLQQNVGGF